MPTLNDLLQRVERLLLRHEELQRTHALLNEQLAAMTQERDSLRSRLSAARQRIDTLIQRLPSDSGGGRMNQLEVTIMGQSYLLACPPGGEAQLQRAVEQVDREMCAIRDAGRIRARERIAVLAALNLAYQLAQSPAPVRTDDGDAPDLGDLVARLDKLLAADGNLL